MEIYKHPCFVRDVVGKDDEKECKVFRVIDILLYLLYNVKNKKKKRILTRN